MRAIELVLGDLAWSDHDLEAVEKMSAVEIKAALLSLVAPFPLFAAGARAVDPLNVPDLPLYGPATRRKLATLWRARFDEINARVAEATGYVLSELTDRAAIVRCMALCGPGEESLRAALHKLDRLAALRGER